MKGCAAVGSNMALRLASMALIAFTSLWNFFRKVGIFFVGLAVFSSTTWLTSSLLHSTSPRSTSLVTAPVTSSNSLSTMGSTFRVSRSTTMYSSSMPVTSNSL